MKLKDFLETYSGWFGLYNGGDFIGNFKDPKMINKRYNDYIVKGSWVGNIYTMEEGSALKLNIDLMCPEKYYLLEELKGLRRDMLCWDPPYSDKKVAALQKAIDIIREIP